MNRQLADLLTIDDHECRVQLVPSRTARGTVLRCRRCNALVTTAEVRPA